MDSRAQNVATLFDPDATLNSLESWAMQLDYQHSHGAELVREVLDDFLPEISFNRIDKLQGRLLFNTQDGIVPLQSLSDGYLSLAAWVGDLLYRVMSQSTLELTQKMSPDGERYLRSAPLEAKGLLLIDEVDLHFHPKWQRQLFEFLNSRLPNFQLIVTTHSPMTAQQAREDQLIIMTRDASSGKIAAVNFIGNPRSLLINQLLMSDLFGLDSDESLEVQEKKARYRKLRDKEHLSANEQRELAKLTTELSSRPVGGRSNLRLQEEEVELLRQIQKELEEQKS